jgi:hypothetical protein
MTRLILALALLALGIAIANARDGVVAAPPSDAPLTYPVQPFAAMKQECVWAATHTGTYVPDSQAERGCTCVANEILDWVNTFHTNYVPRDVGRDAGIDCARKERDAGGNT